jgi:hypothetical protein
LRGADWGREARLGVEAKRAATHRSIPPRSLQAFILFILSLAGVVLSFAGAGAPWVLYTGDLVISGYTGVSGTIYTNLAVQCVVASGGGVSYSNCVFYTDGLATAACVLLVISGVLGFFFVTIPLLVTAACPSRGGGGCCSPVVATVFSVIAFILALAGTACGGSYFGYNNAFYNNFSYSRPGFACAVTATVFWFIAIFVCAALQCMPKSSAPKQVAADPAQFSGQNPNAVVRV